MTREIPSRREWLRRVTVTAAVIGGASSSVAANTRTDEPIPDGGETGSACPEPDAGAVDVRLVPACVDDGTAVFCVTNDGPQETVLEWRAVAPPEERIEFVDCQTVRVVGEFEDVIIEATFLSNGEIGNVIEPVGAVDGVRTFDVREIEGIPDDAIAGTVQAFRDGPVVPGAGDLTASNPEFAACQEAFFGEVLVGDEDDEPEPTADEDVEPDPDELTSLTVPAEATTCFAVDAPDGPVAVQLFRDGELLVERTSASDVACPRPIEPGDDGVLESPTTVLDERQ
ncbi:hypothetical protein [Natronococcus occultus]|uniref:Uncharacterized protein n=1 Tax=Natronococcus occultus SP4 TaxID=694430 RepID=L0K114_9EURY|nr:hypothetical protein [Natronococcus occultus]AGB37793.1 hypothetical protein Natoc_2007 [Natronococcus occultus SP4]